MKRLILLFLAPLPVLAFAAEAFSGVVQTKRGPREGRVISRFFDQIIVTVLDPDKRIFQFPAKDIESITAEEKVLIGVETYLRDTPSEEGETIIPLRRGMEVEILESREEDRWCRVAAWGEHEGWIYRGLLTDRVVFTPEEKNTSASNPANAPPERQAAGETVQPATGESGPPGNGAQNGDESP